jgi:hypothetical protein
MKTFNTISRRVQVYNEKSLEIFGNPSLKRVTM